MLKKKQIEPPNLSPLTRKKKTRKKRKDLSLYLHLSPPGFCCHCFTTLVCHYTCLHIYQLSISFSFFRLLFCDQSLTKIIEMGIFYFLIDLRGELAINLSLSLSLSLHVCMYVRRNRLTVSGPHQRGGFSSRGPTPSIFVGKLLSNI